MPWAAVSYTNQAALRYALGISVDVAEGSFAIFATVQLQCSYNAATLVAPAAMAATDQAHIGTARQSGRPP